MENNENILPPEETMALESQPKPAIHTQKKDPLVKTWIDTLRDLAIILLIVMIVRTTLASPFRISGTSMATSYRDGEVIILDHFSYFKSKNFERELARGDIGEMRTLISQILRWTVGWFDITVGNPERGDVVVFRPHAGNGKDFYIKRVIGIPGDTVKIEGGYTYLKPVGKKEFVQLNESYLSPSNLGNTQISGKDTVFLVPEGKYFLMGDNRQNSSDSRSCFRSTFFDPCKDIGMHFIDRSDILGRVLVSLGNFSMSPSFRIFSDARFLDTFRTWSYPEIQNAQ